MCISRSRELLDRERVLEGRAARAADALGEGDAHPSQLTHPAHDLGREGLGAVELLGHRGDLALGEIAHRTPQQLVVIWQIEEHSRRIANDRSKFE